MVFSNRLGVLPRYKKVALCLAAILLLQLIAGSLIIYLGGLAQTRDDLATISQRAVEDIGYTHGTWNTAHYDSDPDIPGNYRIYVITKDGFVIDRWRPIAGYLDTSDFRQLLAYHAPTTVHTITGQDWRILSLPVQQQGSVLGVVTVGRLLSVAEPGVILVDQELYASAQTLLTNLAIASGQLNTQAINVRSIPFTISFQIVDQYNHILLKSDTANSVDRLPNYIDPSYIADNLQHQSVKMISSAGSDDRYLVESTPLFDANQSPIGTVIVARTILPFIQLTQTYLMVSAVAGALLWALGLYLVVRFGGLAGDTADYHPLLADSAIQVISFTKATCLIGINDHEVPVSYATNQYYMCLALFSRPGKKWETDELVERFGIEHSVDAWRKLYDAMSSINKKCHAVMESNLITASNKTYRINPALVAVVSKSNGK